MYNLFTKEEVGDFIVTMFEGGSNYWIDSIVISRKGCPKDTKYYDVPMEGGSIGVVEFDGDGTVHILDPITLDRGFYTLQKKYPWHFKALAKDEYDVETTDALLQCSLFGDIIYG